MKKIFILMSFMGLILFVSASAFAGDVPFGGKLVVTAPVGATISAMSANVGGQCLSSATNFACILKHLNGTRNFATSSADTKIYYHEVTVPTNMGKMTLEVTLTNSDSQDFSSWSNL